MQIGFQINLVFVSFNIRDIRKVSTESKKENVTPDQTCSLFLSLFAVIKPNQKLLTKYLTTDIVGHSFLEWVGTSPLSHSFLEWVVTSPLSHSAWAKAILGQEEQDVAWQSLVYTVQGPQGLMAWQSLVYTVQGPQGLMAWGLRAWTLLVILRRLGTSVPWKAGMPLAP